METRTPQAVIEGQVRGLLESLGFSEGCEVAVDAQENAPYRVAVRVETEQHFLIGQYGVNLAALQHILRLLCRKALGEAVSLEVDVNGYVEEKQRALEQEARQALEAVERTGQPAELRPMLPYERKLVHTFFVSHPRFATESVGEGAERRIRIVAKQP